MTKRTPHKGRHWLWNAQLYATAKKRVQRAAIHQVRAGEEG